MFDVKHGLLKVDVTVLNSNKYKTGLNMFQFCVNCDPFTATDINGI